MGSRDASRPSECPEHRSETMLPAIFLPQILIVAAEIVATVAVSTLAARAASDVYDSVVNNSTPAQAHSGQEDV